MKVLAIRVATEEGVYVFNIRLFPIVVITVLLSLFIYIVNFSWWMNQTIVDEGTFVEATVVAFQEESSRVALSTIAVERIVEERPVLGVIEPLLIESLTAVLNSPIVVPVLFRIGGRLHGVLFSADAGGIIADLSVIENLVMVPLTVIAPELASEVPEDFFREVVLVEPGMLPDVQRYVEASRSIFWLALAMAIVLLGLLVLLAKPRRNAIYFAGASLAFAGLVSSFIAPKARELTVGAVEDPNTEVLIGNLFDQLVVGLKFQSRWLLVAGFVLIAIGVVVQMARRQQSSQIAA